MLSRSCSPVLSHSVSTKRSHESNITVYMCVLCLAPVCISSSQAELCTPFFFSSVSWLSISSMPFSWVICPCVSANSLLPFSDMHTIAFVCKCLPNWICLSQFEYCRFLRFILIVSACTLPFVFVVYLLFFLLARFCAFFPLLFCWCFVFIFVWRFLTYSICHNLLSDFLLVFIKIWWDTQTAIVVWANGWCLVVTEDIAWHKQETTKIK